MRAYLLESIRTYPETQCFREYTMQLDTKATVVLSQCQDSLIRREQEPTPLSSHATASSNFQGLYQVKLRKCDPIGRVAMAMLNKASPATDSGPGVQQTSCLLPVNPNLHSTTRPSRFNASLHTFRLLYYVCIQHPCPALQECLLSHVVRMYMHAGYHRTESRSSPCIIHILPFATRPVNGGALQVISLARYCLRCIDVGYISCGRLISCRQHQYYQR